MNARTETQAEAQAAQPLQPGVKYARREDHALVTGHGRYTADHQYPGMLHAHVIRAQQAHARITAMDLSAVAAAPGVRRVLTADDVAAFGAQPIANAFAATSKDGQPQKVVRMPLLAKDIVHFAGQPLALVLADTAYAAQDAAELADVTYESLDAVTTMDEALAPGAVQLHEAAPGNVSAHYAHGDAAAVDAAFSQAAHTSRMKVVSQRLIGMPMEPRAVVVVHDSATGITRVHTPTQGMLGMRAGLAALTGVPADQLEISTRDVGGSFGLRGGPYSEHGLLVMAARQLNRPVSWVGARGEIFLSDWHGRALQLEGEVALDAQGRILAIRFADRADMGAYNCSFSTFIGTRNLSITMGGVYKVPALYMESQLVFTNTVPVSAYRGAGRPDIAYAVERLIDHAAHEHGFDPVALRRLNFINPADFPYRTANGTLYDHCDFARVLDRALHLAGWAGFEQRRAQARAAGRLRGIGLASYLEASGAGGAPKDQVQGEFSSDGLLMVFGVTGGSGQGHEAAFAQIIEDTLGLSASRVRYRAGDPSRLMVGNGTGGSRSLYGTGSAVKALCLQLQAQMLPLLAALWACAEDSISFAEGRFVQAGAAGRALTVEALLQQLPPEQRQQIKATGEAQSGMTFPNGCHIAEIEIDPRSGVTRMVNYTAVDDLGTVVSPQLVEGQVHGGVVQGWGQAFCEQVVYDNSGQLLSGSLMDYAMPRLGCVPAMVRETLQVDTTLNLLGAKGVGEAGCSGSLPALSNAVINALRPLGITALDMPYTSAKVWAAIAAAQQATTPTPNS